MKKRALCIFMAVVVILSVFVTASADDISDLKERQDEVKRQGETARDFLNDTENEKSAVLSEVAQLDAELDEAENELEFITRELETTEQNLRETEDALAAAVTRREEQYAAMKQRIRFMYENGATGYIKILLDSENFADFVNRAEYISVIIEYDKNMAEKLRETERLITEERDKIERDKQDILTLRALQEIKTANLEEKIQKKRAALIALTADAEGFRAQIEDLERTDKEIEQLILAAEKEKAEREARERAEREAREKAEREAAARAAAEKAAKEAAAREAAKAPKYAGGALAWPVYGYYELSSGYGGRINPISGKSEVHSGFDIPAPKGTNIHAAAAGTVILAGYNGGFGYCVIIDHGGGLSTLYGHNSKLYVEVGEYVTTGQTIAACGSTGYSTGNHCHFEVRVNGKHTSPAGYLE